MKLFILFLVGCLAQDESIVQTQYGPVKGYVSSMARNFLGIPFAKPPTGQLRWTYPQAPDSWSQPLNCTVFTAGCAQACNLPPLTCPDVISEDCLTVNVYTPRLSKITRPLPVMFFVPGGRFEQGAAGTWLYWGEIVANTSLVIMVTTNYRLGALGFLASETIPGNYGLEDQRFAMKWVQNNIAAFGGDPNSVTLFGQSAGGTSTAVHLTSKASQGLFQKAIIHSNPFTLPMKDPSTAALTSRDFALALRCQPNDLACMRSKTTDEIIHASNVGNDQLNLTDPVSMFYPWTPVVDGVRCDGQPLELFRSGNFTKMPIMVGNVEEEALLFIWEVQPSGPASASEYKAIVELVFGKNAPLVLATYPTYPNVPNFDYRYLMSLMGTDWIFTCPNRYIATGISKYGGGQPLYMYRFNHALSFDAWGPNYTECVGHVCHGSELVYLFQSETQGNSGFLFTDQEQLMADSITAAWTNFAHTSNPNTPPSELSHRMKNSNPVDTVWPTWTPDTDLRITYATVSDEVVPSWRGAYCDFWDKLNYLNPKQQ